MNGILSEHNSLSNGTNIFRLEKLFLFKGCQQGEAFFAAVRRQRQVHMHVTGDAKNVVCKKSMHLSACLQTHVLHNHNFNHFPQERTPC